MGIVSNAGIPAAISIVQNDTLNETASSRPDRCTGNGSGAPTSFDRPAHNGPGSQDSHKSSAERVLRSFNTWAFKREQPSDPRLLLEFVAGAISREEPVPFVLYWGKGLRCSIGAPDLQCLDFLAALAGRVNAVYRPGTEIRLILTDTHAELNGHSQESIRKYFTDIEAGARHRGFQICRLSRLASAADTGTIEPHDEISHDTVLRLCASAKKWYRGKGTAEQGALDYLRINMAEKRAVELAFPRSIFITFNGSELRSLFPKRLPIFYMYSLRRGVSIKPWFLPFDPVPSDFSATAALALADGVR